MLLRRLVGVRLLSVLLFATVSCARQAPLITSDEVRAWIADELHVGASADEIEAFFERHEIASGWNRADERYYGRLREHQVEPYHSISIIVTVDAGRRFVSATVEDSYL